LGRIAGAGRDGDLDVESKPGPGRLELDGRCEMVE
jgi:hypothetical protein